MTKNWMEAIDARSAAALASGALQPVAAEQTEMEDAGMRFIVRWVSSLAVKDAAKAASTTTTPATTPVAIPGGPRDPNFNPFLNPDPELTVGPIGTGHVVILNKFPLCDRHLVLARRAFEEQLLPLARSDFAALAEIMIEAGGIGLYNGGTAAGASQRHKHVQWMPDTAGNASLRLFAPGLPTDLPEHGVARHPALPMQHCFVRVRCGQGVAVDLRSPGEVQDAIERSGILRQFPEIDLATNKVGVFGKLAKLDAGLKPGDRVAVQAPKTPETCAVPSCLVSSSLVFAARSSSHRLLSPRVTRRFTTARLPSTSSMPRRASRRRRSPTSTSRSSTITRSSL